MKRCEDEKMLSHEDFLTAHSVPKGKYVHFGMPFFLMAKQNRSAYS